MEKKIGIIGFGNMGQAIAEYAKKDFNIIVFDKAKEINNESIEVANNLLELLEKSKAIILAVKPQDIPNLLEEIKDNFKKIKDTSKNPLIISMAAGIPTKYFEKKLEGFRVVRVMPNMPAQIGWGVSGLYKGEFADEQDFDLAWQLFSRVGIAKDFNDENMLDAITAISGSGPAYFCYYIKDVAEKDMPKATSDFVHDLTQAAISIGFTDETFAANIAKQTVDGTISLLKEKKWSYEELIEKVASKKGTTEAALNILRNGGSLKEAVLAAKKRAEELRVDFV
ncbi:MAG: pyrroline-5-carboxylate reductase [Candidatus Omnitrophota bacterium]